MDGTEKDKDISFDHELDGNATNNMGIPTLKSQFYNSEGDSEILHFGVYLPSDTQMQDNDGYINVFQDKQEALKLVKKYKKARFKSFQSYHEAAQFAVHGSECPNNNVLESAQGTVAPTPERSNQFRGPKPQDLVKLRKAIESGDKKLVQFTIWDNPRYLISSGDTPSILHEGARYNALHVAAKSLQAEICDLIIKTISDISFIRLLYGDDNADSAEERSKILLDLYLNTPDKSVLETPLHFAVKFGALEVARVLLSYPQCDRNVRNKFGQTPDQIICSRVSDSPNKEKIIGLFEDAYYVPVIRSEDNSTAPVIGEPFSPQRPPIFSTDPLSPRLEIQAYAGPMDKKKAEAFRKKWKTPPRTLFGAAKLNSDLINNTAALRFKDPQKGLECLGRDLASTENVGWKEYWPFLDCFIDLCSKEGLDAFENYLKSEIAREYSVDSDSSDAKIFSPPKTKANHTNFYSHTLSSGNTSALSPISDLCNAFQACNLNENSFKVKQKSPRIKDNIEFVSNCQTAESIIGTLSKSDINPYLCIEKSCQLFANRILNDILFLIENDTNSSTNMLENQMKQLQSLMSSYIDDGRFKCVDFHLVHARIGVLISHKLKYELKLENGLDMNVKNSLESWLNNYNKTIDCFSSDDEDIHADFRTQNFSPQNTAKNTVICLIESILKSLISDLKNIENNINTEEECIAVWNKLSPCTCSWDVQYLSKKKYKKNFSYFSKNINLMKKFDTFVQDSTTSNNIGRKLNFDDTCEDNHEEKYFSESYNSEDSSDDEFYVASNDVTREEPAEEDLFFDSRQPEFDVFIEGHYPTRTDHLVFKALEQCGINITPEEYPNVYKWRHTVALFSNKERSRWVNPRNHCNTSLNSSAAHSTPIKFPFNTHNNSITSYFMPKADFNFHHRSNEI